MQLLARPEGGARVGFVGFGVGSPHEGEGSVSASDGAESHGRV